MEPKFFVVYISPNGSTGLVADTVIQEKPLTQVFSI
jgi:hypothetical protein